MENSCHAWNIDDFVLYLADAPVFSRKPANELLLWKCVIESAPYYEKLLTNLKDENKYLPELSKKILCVVNFVVICNKQCIYIF